jgi:hypothetical protein
MIRKIAGNARLRSATLGYAPLRHTGYARLRSATLGYAPLRSAIPAPLRHTGSATLN